MINMESRPTKVFKNEHSFSNMCRLCLSWNGDTMPSIFDSLKNDGSVTITEVINTFAKISIKEGDGLPERICDSCLTVIERIIEFKQLCEQTDKNLRKFLLSLNGLNGVKANAAKLGIETAEDGQQEKADNSFVFSSISERICVESEVLVVDPTESIIDENQNEFEPPLPDQPEFGTLWNNNYDSLSAKQSADSAFGTESYENGRSKGWSGYEYGLNPNDAFENSSEDDGEIFTCATCHKEFHAKKWLIRHSLLHTDAPPFPCDYCFRLFDSRLELRLHWQDHAAGRPFCNTCGEAFDHPANHEFVRSHLAMHKQAHGHAPQSLGHASQSHVNPAQSLGHAHSDDNCQTCIQGFRNVQELQTHMASHPSSSGGNQIPPGDSSREALLSGAASGLKCCLCSKRFARRWNLQKHIWTMHAGGRLPHRCSTCGKAFVNKADLARHTATHTGERPYSCEICLYSFSRKDKLIRHMRSHSSERPFSCQLCATRFKWKDKLIRHMRTHNDTQLHLYKCKLCPLSFKTRPELNKHNAVHSQPVVYLSRIDDVDDSSGKDDVIRSDSNDS